VSTTITAFSFQQVTVIKYL